VAKEIEAALVRLQTEMDNITPPADLKAAWKTLNLKLKERMDTVKTWVKENSPPVGNTTAKSASAPKTP
jgi:hypothetical protein